MFLTYAYRKFLTTIRYVDERIKEIQETIRNFYNDDGRTTFLMTSDHGMTDWGKDISISCLDYNNKQSMCKNL